MKFIGYIVILLIAILLFYMVENHREGIVFGGASPYNMGWDGTSNMVEYLRRYGDVVLVRDWIGITTKLSSTDTYGCRIILIVAPDREYQKLEIDAIARLYKKHRFSIAILDEGFYSNTVLEALGIPARIRMYSFIETSRRQGVRSLSPHQQLYSLTEAIPGYIVIDDEYYYVVFSYISPIDIKDPIQCREIAYIPGVGVVGALCDSHGNKVLILGDSSIAINAVIPLNSSINIYTSVIDGIIRGLCSQPSGKVLFLVEAAKYRLRVLTLSELIDRGYSGLKALALTLNPFRYAYVVSEGYPMVLSVSGILICISMIFVMAVHSRRGRAGEQRKREILSTLGYRHDILELVVEVCKSDEQCAKDVPCVLKKLNKKCIKLLSEYLSRCRAIRRSIIEKITASEPKKIL